MRGNPNKEENLFLSPHPGLLPGGEGETQTRWRCFSRDWIKTQKGDSLDIAWLKDQDSVDAANLPEPDILAAEAMSELNGLMLALGVGDEAKLQRQLLSDTLALQEEQ